MRITLVTPTLNAGRYLAEALASVRSQQWPDVEHIVMDGGSTDDTLEILGRDPAEQLQELRRSPIEHDASLWTPRWADGADLRPVGLNVVGPDA